MKQNTKILVAVIALIIIGTIVYAKRNPVSIPSQVSQTPSNPIIGCYIAHLSKDVYSLTIISQHGKNVTGTLDFKNFDKDSSSGTFAGTYKNGILLGEYSFSSEGMNSVTQVIFKKQGFDFVRGYGPLDANGTHFTDLSAITYNQSAVFALSTSEHPQCTD
jgi:hypothetical protein